MALPMIIADIVREHASGGHPAITDVAVIDVPDDRWGEAVKAIAGYTLPKSVDFVDTLPRNPTGKILKREWREPYCRGKERRIN